MSTTVAEAYQSLNENYDAVLKRLLGKENLVVKYLKMFREDTTYQKLCAAVADNNAEDALRAAHTLKGMSFNLGLNNLGSACSDMVESIRSGSTELDGYFSRIRSEYERFSEAFGQCL